jgi:hypothetical protein
VKIFLHPSFVLKSRVYPPPGVNKEINVHPFLGLKAYPQGPRSPPGYKGHPGTYATCICTRETAIFSQWKILWQILCNWIKNVCLSCLEPTEIYFTLSRKFCRKLPRILLSKQINLLMRKNPWCGSGLPDGLFSNQKS